VPCTVLVWNMCFGCKMVLSCLWHWSGGGDGDMMTTPEKTYRVLLYVLWCSEQLLWHGQLFAAPIHYLIRLTVFSCSCYESWIVLLSNLKDQAFTGTPNFLFQVGEEHPSMDHNLPMKYHGIWNIQVGFNSRPRVYLINALWKSWLSIAQYMWKILKLLR
jgi:hypothetical protein